MLTIHDTILYQFVRAILSRQRSRVGQQQHASLMRRMLSPHFSQRFICLSKVLVVLMVYFIP